MFKRCATLVLMVPVLACSRTPSVQAQDPTPAHPSPKTAAGVEALPAGSVRVARDGQVYLNGSPAGRFSGSLQWNEMLQKALVTVWSPEHLGLSDFAAVQLANGHLLAVSGSCGPRPPQAVSNLLDVEAWAADRRSLLDGPPTKAGPKPQLGRASGSGTLLSDGRVLIVGGTEKGAAYKTVLPAELYDPQKGSFILTGSLHDGRRDCVVTALADGRALVTGGIVGPGPIQTVEKAEVYDGGTFKSVAAMLHPRYRHAAVRLATGKVLIIGGCSSSPLKPDPTELESFDPTSGTFSSAGTLPAPVNDPVAVLLSNGDVLVTGGTSVQTAPVVSGPGGPNAVTGYFPSANSWIIHQAGSSAYRPAPVASQSPPAPDLPPLKDEVFTLLGFPLQSNITELAGPAEFRTTPEPVVPGGFKMSPLPGVEAGLILKLQSGSHYELDYWGKVRKVTAVASSGTYTLDPRGLILLVDEKVPTIKFSLTVGDSTSGLPTLKSRGGGPLSCSFSVRSFLIQPRDVVVTD